MSNNNLYPGLGSNDMFAASSSYATGSGFFPTLTGPVDWPPEQMLAPPPFTLKLLQQPERARLCSFKEENDTMDRRPVDPPPVVELGILASAGSSYDSSTFFIRGSIVHGTPDPMQDVHAGCTYSPAKTPTGAEAAAGEVVQTPEKLKDLDGRQAIMCIFAKLSVRMPGIFRLRFTLFEATSTGVRELAFVTSEAFEVFSPKLFKGMKESTPLTRHLASQGLKVKLRTDTSVGRHSEARKRGTQTATSPPQLHDSASRSIPAASPTTLSAQTSPLAPGVPYMPRSEFGPSRSLVWQSHFDFPNQLLGDQDRRASGSLDSPGPSAKRFRMGDDGMMPPLTEISGRHEPKAATPSFDLSVFSLFQPPSQPSSSENVTAGARSSMTTKLSRRSSNSSSSSARPLSPFISHSTETPVSSTTSPSPAVPPLMSRLDLGPGDDGIPVLPVPGTGGASLSHVRSRISDLLSTTADDTRDPSPSRLPPMRMRED